jgi:hypothetical protein
MAIRREYVASLYRDLLGREGSDSEIEGHLNNPGGEQGLYDFFTSSPEYTSAHGGTAGWHNNESGQVVQGPQAPSSGGYQVPGGGPTSGTMPPGGGHPPIYGTGTGTVTPTPGGYSGAAYAGFTPHYDYSAFNTGREQDPAKSAKDAFAMISNQAPPPPFQSKPAMAQWFNQYVKPGMDALGHKVLSVSEDGFTYTNHEGTFFVDFGQNSGAAPGSMQQRLQWNATPADAATAARYQTGGGGGGAGAGGGSTVQDIRSIFQSFPPGTNFSGPGGPGITTGPLEQVGQDPFSTLITNALASIIQNGGQSQSGLGQSAQDALSALLDQGGGLDEGQIASRYESARELLDKGRRTMVGDLRGDLASRNLLSEPGIPQGAEIGGLERITESIAPEFSRALRDIYTDESAKADTRLMTSLSMALNVSQQEAQTMLAALGQGTDRQTALANIALQSLSQNQAWSMFLAQFGLDRDMALWQMQNGQIDQILPILQMFLQLGGQANQGYV